MGLQTGNYQQIRNHEGHMKTTTVGLRVHWTDKGGGFVQSQSFMAHAGGTEEKLPLEERRMPAHFNR